MVRVTVREALLHCQARVEHEYSAVRPWGQQTSLLGRGFEVRVIVLQRDVDVF